MPDRKSWEIKVTMEGDRYVSHCGVRGCKAVRKGGDSQLVFDFMKGHMASSHIGKRGQTKRDARTVYVGDEFKFVKKY